MRITPQLFGAPREIHSLSFARSVDVHFGPTPPAGQESNWIQTSPGKGWFVLLRLYGPLEAWFDRSWQPGEIELVP